MRLKTTLIFIIIIIIVVSAASAQSMDPSLAPMEPLEIYDYDYNNEFMEFPVVPVEMEVVHSILSVVGSLSWGIFMKIFRAG